MTTQELLKEVLNDSLFQDKYHIPQSELQEVSFDTTSPYPLSLIHIERCIRDRILRIKESYLKKGI